MIREAVMTDWEQISEVSRISGYIDYINSIGKEFMKHGKIYVYSDNSRILGFLNVSIMPDKSTWMGALRVHPDARRLGVGLSLTVEAIRKSGSDTVRCLIHHKNEKSLNLVKKLNFKISQEVCSFEGIPTVLNEGESIMEYPKGYVADRWSFYKAEKSPPKEFKVVSNRFGTFMMQTGHCTIMELKEDFQLEGNDYSILYAGLSEIPEFFRHHLYPEFDMGYIMELNSAQKELSKL